MNILKHIYSKHQKKIIFLLIIIIGYPLIMYVLNMLGAKLLGVLIFILAFIGLVNISNIQIKDDEAAGKNVFKFFLYLPFFVILSVIASQLVIVGVANHYVQAPPDYHWPEGKKLLSRLDVEKGFDQVNKFGYLIASPSLVSYKEVKCEKCDLKNETLYKVTKAQDSLCKGLEIKEEITNFIASDVNVFHILSPFRPYDIAPNDKSSRSEVNICVQFEKVDKIPNDVVRANMLINRDFPGNVVKMREVRGYIPYHIKPFEDGGEEVTGDNIIPVKTCGYIDLSYWNLFENRLYGGKINPKDFFRCQTNNLAQ